MKPRNIDFDKAFNSLVDWTAQTVKDAPSLVVGLSGTDSALAYVLCSKALEAAGKDKNALMGMHYGDEYDFGDYFKQYGSVQVVDLPKNTFLEQDIYRWAAIQTYAMEHQSWIVGTRNKTEQLLGDYSNASLVAVMQPLLPLWKSEVLALCKHLGMPEKMITASCLGDPKCYCHKPGLLRRLSDCETVLALQQKERELGNITPEENNVLRQCNQFLAMYTDTKTYKSKIPYTPPAEILSGAIVK